jgi:transposase-like protein
MTHEERQERRKAIAGCVRSGKSLTEASRMYGTTVNHIQKACRESGVVYPRKQTITGRTWDILAALFDARRSQASIARKFGVTRSTVSVIQAHAIKAGIPVPKRNGAKA